MSVIRPLAPPHCPECDAEGTLFIDTDRRLTCKLCNYKAPFEAPEIDPGTPVDAPENLEARRKSYTVTWGLINPVRPDPWVMAAYETALYATKQARWDDAIRDFKRALEQDKDFLDAHLWLARLSDDDTIRRDHYGSILAMQPNHIEAIRELMVLNGQLSDEEAARAGNAAFSPAAVAPGAAVAADSVEIACAICGSHELTVQNGKTICQTCGNEQKSTDNGKGYGFQSMSMAMLKKRGKRIDWIVGEHILHCDNCGAERILQKKMASECPFCGSKKVLKSDVFDSFQQPDGVVPFRITKQKASDILDEVLNSRVERFKGMFINNKVDRITYTPIYVPFWYFDAVLQVMKSVHDNRAHHGAVQAYQRSQFTEMAHDAPVAAVKSPPPKLLARLAPYDVKNIQPYDPTLLAKYQAEIYTLDFDRASLEARSDISQYMREKHGHTGNPTDSYSVQIQCMFQQMSFRLLLLPVVVATIVEKDGDVRPALINGQSGKVVPGRAHKPD